MSQQISISFRRTASDLSSPVGDSSPSHSHSTSNTDNMVRSSLAKPVETTKRKRTLTPSQLAHKRASDRKAQRAIRARTKEHIQRLERELEELKDRQGRDQMVQELLRRNKVLEEELIQLKETMGMLMISSPYSTPVYDDNLSSGSSATPSPHGSPFPSGGYNSLSDYGQQYAPLPNNCEPWANTVPCPVPSNVSSPSSSVDDYSAGYTPTSVTASMPPSNNTGASGISAVGHDKDVIKMEYEVDHHDAGFRLSNPSPPSITTNTYMQQQHHHQHQQPAWKMYPVYYAQAQFSVH